MCNGFHFRRESLKIKAFYIHFSSQSHPPPAAAATLPLQKAALLHDFLTLRFLPRMIRDPLEIDGSLIQAGTGTGGGGGRGPAFLTLHKLMSSSPESVSVIDNPTHVYGSRDHVKASEGVRFEIYNGDAKVLTGSIRKDEEGNWKLDCKRGGGSDNIDGVLELDYGKEAYVEVAVDVDGQVEFLNGTVKMMMYQAARRRVIRRNLQTRLRPISGLEEIPEESAEEELEIESDGSCCCDCDPCGTKQEEEMEMEGEDCEMEMEIENGSSWAVDAAILVVSLGVGYLVSRASAKKLVRHWR